MNIVVFLIVGLVAGWLASALMRGRGLGLIGDIVIGVIGAFLGGFLLGLFGIFSEGIVGFIIQSFIGAVVLLIIIKALRKI